MKPITGICLDGVGKMGQGMAQRWRQHGIEVVGYDLNPEVTDVGSLQELVGSMPAGERVIWLMLPLFAYEPTLDCLASLLTSGDMIIDGGNTQWRVTQARHERFSALGVHYVDVGTSGGVYGQEMGYAVMVGSTDEEFLALEPILKALAPDEDGYVHAGSSGAGHYAKQTHNAIEYGMMAAFGEGYNLLTAMPMIKNPADVLASWRHGSIVQSFLLDLTVEALRGTEEFAEIAPVALDSGEGRWAMFDAIESGVPAPVISAALNSRFASQGTGNAGLQLVAALRHQFGGHAVVHPTD